MHVITDKLKRAPNVGEGQNSNGPWKRYSFDVSESFLDKNKERLFTNYRVTIWAKTPKMMDFLDNNLVEGAVVEVGCDTLTTRIWDSESGPKAQIEMVNPQIKRIIATSSGQGSGGQAPARNPQPQSNNSGWGQNNPSPQQSKTQDDDDDIPF